ncbi:hypothetical protein CAP51_00915 [Acinetobacter populi]|jgi:hypothetical protein|uniref:Lipoprotein n=2 Tax=Acinetobacter populi TaxID=1582270 RepID=A0A1Z9Z178_9GAMM|nr:hypothetical protein CAP51_00915 [Acinetobacter populi]
MFKIISILSIGFIFGLTACQDRKNHDPVNDTAPETTTPHTFQSEPGPDANSPNIPAPVNNDAPRAAEMGDEVSPTTLHDDTSSTGTTSTNPAR